MAKFFYFAQRNPALTVQTFPARWRRHAALAMTMRSWDNKLLYVQADALQPSPHIPISSSYDGFCYGLTQSEGLLRPASPQDEADDRTLLIDELAAFEGPILPRVMLFEEEILLAGGFGVVACLAFHDTQTAKAVGVFHSLQPGMERVIVNTVQPSAPRDVAAANFAAVVEICAIDEMRLLSAIRSGAMAGGQNAAAIVLAKEIVLWDRRRERTQDKSAPYC